MSRLKEKQKLNIQFWLGVAMIVAGLTLLFMGFWTVPIGEISNSVLIAFGEVLTFVGSIFGIDYKYRYKIYESRHPEDCPQNDEE